MDRKAIGQRIKTMREERGWAQNRLSILAGVSPSCIRDLEKGLKCPTVETLDSICFALGITLTDFLSPKKEDAFMDKVSSLTDNQKRLLNEFLNSL